MRHSSSSALGGHARLRERRFRGVVDRRVGRGGGFLEPLHVLQHAPLVLQGDLFAGFQAALSISLRWNDHRSSRRSFSCSERSSSSSSAAAARQSR